MFDGYDFNAEYQCSKFTKSRHFTKCMYLMINLNTIEKLESRLGTEIFREYVEHNPDEVLIRNKKGWTLLSIAVRNSKCLNLFDCIDILLKSTVFKNSEDVSKYVNMGTNKGVTPLELACQYSNTDSSLETVKLLLKYGANVNSVEDQSPLMSAVEFSHDTSTLETVKLLLRHGADVNLIVDGWTSLMLAARNSGTTSNVQTVKLLLRSGADPNILRTDGRTALSMAVRNSSTDSNLETVEVLLKSGADPNLRLLKKASCLDIANMYCKSDSSLETVEILLRYGAKMNYKELKYNKLHIEAIKSIILFDAIHKNAIPQLALMRTLSQPAFANCIKCINMVSHQKLCFKHVLQEIRVRAGDCVYRPQSLRTQLMFLKYNLDEFGFKSVIPQNLQVYLSCTQLSTVATTTSQTFETLHAFLVENLRFAD